MKIAPWIIISVLIGLLFLQMECHRCPELPENNCDSDTLYIPGDPYPKPYPVVAIVYHDSIVYDTVPQKVDTALILKDYFAKIYGHDTIADDSSVFVAVNYMVTQNRLKWLKPAIQNRKPTTIIQNTSIIEKYEPRLKLFAGVGVGRSLTSFGLAASISVVGVSFRR
jgi:hypothetical protein